MNKLNALDLISLILMIVGGLNWGLVGVINLNIVDAIFGVGSLLSSIVYILVGLASVYILVMLGKLKRA
ncbi:DUF378 domain-containing protein [Patescibacteria group bacterium]|nr:DUF378 domain-containing protein [Patescibacteria group bacterium]